MNVVTRTLVAVLVAAGAGPACAQEEPDAWRAGVDRLLDRWTDDAGASRLTRARDLLRQRVEAAVDDAGPLVELARVELALARPDKALDLAEKALFHFGTAEEAERRRLHEVNLTREKNGLPPLEPGEELADRRSQALALAYLAAHEDALTRARGLEGPQAAAALRERQAELSRRRQALTNMAGEEQAGQLLRLEASRRAYLRTLDRLGAEPRPLGQADAAGQPIDFKAYRGKLLLVVFWSQALGGCEQVLQDIAAVQRETADQGLEVLGVCLDAPGGQATQWLAEQKITWRQVFTSEGLMSRDARAWSIDTVPSGVLIDHTGKVRWIDPWEGDLRLAVAELARRRQEAADEDRRRGW